ncbi:MAG: hypothetical protein QE271_11815 [Bacteriovoracaceae bacterium]|nr:hypothetical protein [Bacteriovoracaceae bacterium]
MKNFVYNFLLFLVLILPHKLIFCCEENVTAYPTIEENLDWSHGKFTRPELANNSEEPVMLIVTATSNYFTITSKENIIISMKQYQKERLNYKTLVKPVVPISASLITWNGDKIKLAKQTETYSPIGFVLEEWTEEQIALIGNNDLGTPTLHLESDYYTNTPKLGVIKNNLRNEYKNKNKYPTNGTNSSYISPFELQKTTSNTKDQGFAIYNEILFLSEKNIKTIRATGVFVKSGDYENSLLYQDAARDLATELNIPIVFVP